MGEWETENYCEGEVKEMCEIYIQKGCLKEDALTLMTVMAKYKDLFVEHMMVMEHGILLPDDEDKWQPLKQGFVCFAAFAAFGLVPLVGFFCVFVFGGDNIALCEAIAYSLTVCTLFTMGVAKSKLTGQEHHLKSGLLMVVNGTVAGGVAYLIGETLAVAFGDS